MSELDKKYLGKDGTQQLVKEVEERFSPIGHGHTASEVGADTAGSAAAALTLAKEHTNTQIDTLSSQVAYINEEDNENIANPDVSASEITVDSALSETSTNPVQNKVVTAKLKELEGNTGGSSSGGIYTLVAQTDWDSGDTNITEGSYDEVIDALENGKVVYFKVNSSFYMVVHYMPNEYISAIGCDYDGMNGAWVTVYKLLPGDNKLQHGELSS